MVALEYKILIEKSRKDMDRPITKCVKIKETSIFPIIYSILSFIKHEDLIFMKLKKFTDAFRQYRLNQSMKKLSQSIVLRGL